MTQLTKIFIQLVTKITMSYGQQGNNGSNGIMIEEIYEKIILTSEKVDLNGNMIKINYPSDIFGFMSQLESSTLIDCNQTSAKELLSKRRPDKQRYGLTSLIEMKSLAKELQFPVMISSGSHLGWYRECAANSFTGDADFHNLG